MPGIDDRRGKAAAPHQAPSWSGLSIAPSDFDSLVNMITFNGNLAALLACVCEKALEYESPSHADPGHAPHPGVQAAIRAFASAEMASPSTAAASPGEMLTSRMFWAAAA